MPVNALYCRNNETVRVGSQTVLAELNDLPGDIYVMSAKANFALESPASDLAGRVAESQSRVLVRAVLTFTLNGTATSMPVGGPLQSGHTVQDISEAVLISNPSSQVTDQLTLSLAIDAVPRVFAESNRYNSFESRNRYMVRLEAGMTLLNGSESPVTATNITLLAMTADGVQVIS